MKKLIKLLTSRLFLTILVLLVEVTILFAVVRYLSEKEIFHAIRLFVGIFFAFLIFGREDSSDYKISWIVIVLIAPLFGSCLYCLFGNKKLKVFSKRKKTCIVKTNDQIYKDVLNTSVKPSSLPDEYKKLATYVQSQSGSLIYENTQTKYYPLGDYAEAVLIDEIKKARKFILMEYFIVDKGQFYDKILDVLKEKVKSGVKVCFMYDDMGSISTLPRRFDKELRKFGINTVVFNPVKPRLNPRLNYRDHRKMCIIDGDTVISGGINIADEYINRKIKCGHWKDNIFVLRGYGVWNYTIMFCQLWNIMCSKEQRIENYTDFKPSLPFISDGYVQSFEDSPLDDLNTSRDAYIHIVNNASKYVWLSTPYLILDSSMQDALRLCAKSGVDVRIIVPSISDSTIVDEITKSNYKILLESGVKIYEYAPGFIHSKMFISDDSCAIIGTANMDFRSFFLNFECGTVFYGGSILGSVKKDFINTFDKCNIMPSDYYKKLKSFRKLERMILKIVSPML